MKNIWIGIPSASLLLLLGGCNEPAIHVASMLTATRQGDSITFPNASPQLASIATTSATAAKPRRLQVTGRLAWDEDRTVRMYPPVTGRIESIAAALGAQVNIGDELMNIVSPDIGQAQADLAKSQADLAQAERGLTRVTELHAHGAVATKDVESALSDRDRARFECERCSSRLSLWGAYPDSVDQHFILRAPVAGTVVERNAAQGTNARVDAVMSSLPQASAPLVVISDPAHLWLWLDLPEAELGAVKVGMPLTVNSRAWPGKVFTGVVAAIMPALDPVTRVVRARAVIENAQGLLHAEQFVVAEIAVPSFAKAQVPKRAAFLVGEHWEIFVCHEVGHFERREVSVGAESGDRIEVTAGLEPDEAVVTEGVLLLNNLLNDAG